MDRHAPGPKALQDNKNKTIKRKRGQTKFYDKRGRERKREKQGGCGWIKRAFACL
jgi:hypothetical protein